LVRFKLAETTGGPLLGQVQDIDLKLLRVFRAVVRNGGFAAAQTDLNVSLPTISLQMKQLEERLGLRLCERGHGGFRLTPQGEAVMRAAEPLFAAIDGFRNELDSLTGAPLGEVRLGMLDHLAPNPDCKVHQAVSKLHENFAGVELIFFVGPPAELESQILGGSLDLAVGLFPRTNAALSYLTLFEEEHDLYCGVGHPLFARNDADFADEALLACDYVSWAYLEPLVAAKAALPFKARSGTPFMEGVVALLQSGRFIGYLPRYFAERWIATGQIRALLPGKVSRRVEVTAISRIDGRKTRGVAALHDEMVKAHAA
jgi:DNA-binding transcriptional LysR family regulator